MQIPYLARHCRVVTFDGRGNGRSDRPVAGYEEQEFAADALAVMNATGYRARGARLAVARSPARAAAGGRAPGPVAGPSSSVRRTPLGRAAVPIARVIRGTGLDTGEGWAKDNRHYWLRITAASWSSSLPDVQRAALNQVDRGLRGWGLETTAETLIATCLGSEMDEETARELCGRVRCPVLVIQGTADEISGAAMGVALAEATGGDLVLLEGSGHGSHGDPVKVNLLLREFAVPRPARPRWARGAARPKRALYISSPIGLGHVQRDVAIAGELRKLHPGLQVDWLAQHPVTTVLEARGEHVHPASAHLASESGHIESESAEHDLHAFQAIRRMDEILLANFMVFHDLTREEDYDLWIGDESWELDYYLHENPEQKTAAYAWLTNFVGWLPMPDGREPEALLVRRLQRRDDRARRPLPADP